MLVYLKFVFSSALVALVPLAFGWFVNALENPSADRYLSLSIYLVGYAGIYLLSWILHGPARIAERKLAFSISKDFLDDHMQKLLALDIDWHNNNHTAATINRLRKGYLALRFFFDNGFSYLRTFIQFFFAFFAMAFFSPWFALIAVFLGLITAWIIFMFDKSYSRHLSDLNEKEHSFFSAFNDSLSNILVVITLRLEKQIKNEVLRKFSEMFPSFSKGVVVNEWKWFVANMMVVLTYCVMVGGYVYQQSSNDHFNIAGLVTLVGFVAQFTGVFYGVADQYTAILRYSVDVKTTKTIIESFEALDNKPMSDGILQSDWKTLDIRDMCFHYANKNAATTQDDKNKIDRNVINELNISLRSGQKIALLGKSGSGKSTLLSLLRGLHRPQSGTVVLDGKHPLDWQTISNATTYMPQEPQIFEGSVSYNLTLGLPFSLAEIADACDATNFDEVLKSLPGELDAHVHENGANLSGGQRQRLALARGLLASQSSSIILIDEPSNSLDSHNSSQILTSLFKKMNGKLVICSLHHRDLVKYFDYVYVLQDGTVIEEGPVDKALF